MKKVAAILIGMLMVAVGVYSQGTNEVVNLPVINVTSKSVVSRLIDSAFVNTFPKETRSVWFRSNKSYLAYFIVHDTGHQQEFKRNKSLKYLITYTDEDELPGEITSLLSMAYDSYRIINAARISRAGKELWIINLENAFSYVMIREDEGDLIELKRILKTPQYDKAAN